MDKMRNSHISSESLTDYLTVEEFADYKSLETDRVIAMITHGFYEGGRHNNQWYVHRSEFVNPYREEFHYKFTDPKSFGVRCWPYNNMYWSGQVPRVGALDTDTYFFPINPHLSCLFVRLSCLLSCSKSRPQA